MELLIKPGREGGNVKEWEVKTENLTLTSFTGTATIDPPTFNPNNMYI